MSRCFTWFPIGGLGKPKLYQNMWCFTRMGDFTWWYFGGCLFYGGRDYCPITDELYLTKKMSIEPELVFPSNPPLVKPVK